MKLRVSHEKYIKRVLERFNMKTVKLSVHLQKLTSNSVRRHVHPQRVREMTWHQSLTPRHLKSYVCHGVHSPRYCTLSGSSQQIYDESKKRLLACSEMDIQILEGQLEDVLDLWRYRTDFGEIYKYRYDKDLDGIKSISGYLFNFVGGAVSWQSR